MLRIAFVCVLTAHALIHLLGVVKGFGLAPLEALRVPISRPMGVVWLVAAVVSAAAVVALLVAPRWFWLLGAVALVASQAAIVASWSDARFGTLANVVLLLGVVYGAFAWGPFGLRAEYERRVRDTGTGSPMAAAALVIEADLTRVPAAVQRYLRFAGVVGSRRPNGFSVRMSGRIRGSATAAWMPFAAEQHTTFDPPRRSFFLQATRGGLPLDGLHVYGDGDASMRIRLLSLLPVVELRGAELARTETVTVLNDIAIFAPARLLDPAIRWREVDASSAEATYTNGPHTIRAVLVVDASGALVDFWSDDRSALAEDGKTMLRQRWSTALRDHAPMGGLRLATRGEGRYAAADGTYAYLELEVHEVRMEHANEDSTVQGSRTRRPAGAR